MKQNKDREEFEKDWQYEFDNLKKKFRLNRFRWEYQKEVIIGWVVNTFFEDVIEHPDIQSYTKKKVKETLNNILEENHCDLDGTYDYDGIAKDVIDLIENGKFN